MGNRKRSRSVAKDGHSNCPFTIRYETSSSAAQQNLRRYKEQKSPFSPTGSFKTGDAMGLYYAVEPRKRWQGMTCCESFNHNGVKYFREDFVFVANERTIEQQKAQGDRKHIQKSNEYWVAFILEIRASDDDHVYARVYWMYWPEDLPRGTHDGNKKVQSRQPYHGANEVIASNHKDIIDVVSVTGPAAVTQWIETHDQEIQSAMYWRQGYDYRTLQLSSAELVCNCQTPANPDKTLIGCTTSERKRWMHYECAARDVLMKVYQRLGTDKPHRTEGLAAKEGKLEEVARLLSPTDVEKTETQPMIYVRSAEMNDDAQTKRPTQETRPETVTLTLGPTQPHLQLFSANLKTQDYPIVWEIHDLRKNVIGGEKVWTEEAHCPCGTPLHFSFNMTTT